MIPRRRSLTILVAAVLLDSGVLLTTTQAGGITSGMVDYTLTTTKGLPAPTVPVPGTVFDQTGTITSGSPLVTVSSTNQLSVGDPVSGSGISTGTTISQINGLQLTLSQDATQNGTESLAFTSIPVPQVIALINPAGGVVTPTSTSTSGPLVPIDPPSGLKIWDYLATTTKNGPAVQALGLSFYGTGLPAGGVLNFSLDVTNVNDPPQLVSLTKDVSITLVEGPEPLSLVVWSALAMLGLVHIHNVRRKGGLLGLN